jgi:predicted alpha-1,2-mannosidase
MHRDAKFIAILFPYEQYRILKSVKNLTMTLKNVSLFLVLIMIAGCTGNQNDEKGAAKDEDLTKYVNPFIGTDQHGHTFPGAAMPFGMVQLSPDTRLEGWDGCGGYHYSDSIVYGFSHTHLSGTGVPDYCDILFMPTTGEIRLNNGADDNQGYASRFNHQNEKATAGFYSCYLEDYKVSVELTATKRSGFHKYTFPESKSANIIIDLTHRDKVIESGIKIINEQEIEGFRRSTGWANNQVVYFAAKFSKPFVNSGIESDKNLIQEKEVTGDKLKAFMSFYTEANEEILVKVGISSVSIEGARKNLDSEIPGWEFDRIKQDAKEAWNSELHKIYIDGGTVEQKTTFYTAMYHAFLVPNLFMDVDGNYRGRDFNIYKAEGFDYFTVFSLWDTFRGEHPLFTITQQKRTVDFIKTMIAQYEHGGRLPVWELAANETECMIGYHAIPVIADAYIKGIRDFDAEKAVEAMKHSAELDHFGLKSYKEYGYIPAENEAESVSKTLEYAYDDWCIAIMAKELGKLDDYKRYMERAQAYKNIFDPSTGFMRAKMNGRWFEPFDPREVNFNYTEANSWQYSFFVPQDVSGLVEMMGGKENFIESLDQLFSENSATTGREQSDITGLIGQYAHGNEPSHHMAYLYNYVGQPWKTQQRARQIMDDLYSEKPDGLCGNEDCGQMSAWYVLSALGFYPVTPSALVYAFGSPLFAEATINLENGKSFKVSAVNNSPENIYIQTVKLNGKNYTKSFITHSDIIQGGEIVFEMGADPNKKRGTGQTDIPVSEITENLIMPVPYIGQGARTFIDTTVITLGSIIEGAEIFYTLDGTKSDNKSLKYSEPVILNNSATVNAIAYKEGMPQSKALTARFHKIPIGRKITLSTKYANQYSAGGDLALIDFIRGPLNFRTGAWQGYEGVDLDAIIDLGSIQLISKLEIGFMQDVGAWIFLPEKVNFAVSNDGKNYQQIASVKNDVSEKDTRVQIKNFTSNLSTKAKYIKIFAKNRGICPEWHWGAGQKAWIFADEIVIE